MGTVLNVFTVLLGGVLGLMLGARLPDRMRESVLWALGLFTLGLGLKMFLETNNALIVLGSLLVGGLLGEWWRVQDRLHALGAWLEARFAQQTAPGGAARFIRGFVSASLLFCVGPMTILGSIQDGLTGDFQTLAVKAVLDGFAALAFASSMGVGVLFSALVILVYQGVLTLLAAQAQAWLTPAMLTEMTATGGVMIMAIGVGSLLELRPMRVANYLPALALAPWLVGLVGQFGG